MSLNENECEVTQPTISQISKAERPSVKVELQRRRDKAAEELAQIDEAIAIFNSQPELEKALSALGRIGIKRY
jgi:precorrin-4 methylase